MSVSVKFNKLIWEPYEQEQTRISKTSILMLLNSLIYKEYSTTTFIGEFLSFATQDFIAIIL